jgi:hypothetical protein
VQLLMDVVVLDDVAGVVVVVVEPVEPLLESPDALLALVEEPLDDELGVAVTVGQLAASSVFSCVRAVASADLSSVSCCSSAVTVKLAWATFALLSAFWVAVGPASATFKLYWADDS